MPYKRLDRVVAIKTHKGLTEGKIYTVLGVKDQRLLISIDNKQGRKYLSMNFFMPEEQYFAKRDRELRDKLENRGF